jgi:hypothetical protein
MCVSCRSRTSTSRNSPAKSSDAGRRAHVGSTSAARSVRRGCRGALVRSTWFRDRRSQLARARRRDRPRGAAWTHDRVLRSEDAQQRSLRFAGRVGHRDEATTFAHARCEMACRTPWSSRRSAIRRCIGDTRRRVAHRRGRRSRVLTAASARAVRARTRASVAKRPRSTGRMTRRGGAPARRVPVPAQIGRVAWHDDLVSFAFADLVIASGAAVGLRRLVRMHVADFDVVGGAHGGFRRFRWPTGRGPRRSRGPRR